MKKFFVLLLAVAAIVFTMSGCSAVVDSLKTGVSRIINGGIGEYAEEFKNIVTLSGDVIEESIVPEDGKEITSVVLEGVAFNAVENGTAFIRIVPSDENRVELKYQSDLPEHGFYKIAENGEFKITAKRGTQFRTACFVVTVYSECETVNIAGGIELYMDGCSKNNLTIEIQGAVDAEINGVNVSSMNIKVDGAGEFDISGKAENFSAEFNGAGELYAKELICKDVSVTINGAGEAEISCTDSLNTSINGAGSLNYYGSPKVVRNNSGAAAVTQKSVNVYGK